MRSVLRRRRRCGACSRNCLVELSRVMHVSTCIFSAYSIASIGALCRVQVHQKAVERLLKNAAKEVEKAIAKITNKSAAGDE